MNPEAQPAAGAETPEDAELAQVLDACLADIEAGRAVDVERLLAEHPSIAGRLRACLASMQLVEPGARRPLLRHAIHRRPHPGYRLPQVVEVA